MTPRNRTRNERRDTTVIRITDEEREAIDRAFSDIGSAFGRVAETLGGYFDRAIPQIVDSMNAILVVMRHAYDDAGQPYGDSHDGMLRWVREIGEARRHIDEAERILDNHRALAAFRHRLASRNERPDGG